MEFIILSDVRFCTKCLHRYNVYMQKTIWLWDIIASVYICRPITFLWDCLIFITINILAYNMDDRKQQKPFSLADNKASLVFIPWTFTVHTYQGHGVDSSGRAQGQVTTTDKELKRNAHGAISIAFSEYLIFNSHNINFTYLKRPLGMWDMILYLCFRSLLLEQNFFTVASLILIVSRPQNRVWPIGYSTHICWINDEVIFWHFSSYISQRY